MQILINISHFMLSNELNQAFDKRYRQMHIKDTCMSFKPSINKNLTFMVVLCHLFYIKKLRQIFQKRKMAQLNEYLSIMSNEHCYQRQWLIDPILWLSCALFLLIFTSCFKGMCLWAKVSTGGYFTCPWLCPHEFKILIMACAMSSRCFPHNTMPTKATIF